MARSGFMRHLCLTPNRRIDQPGKEIFCEEGGRLTIGASGDKSEFVHDASDGIEAQRLPDT